MKPLVAVAVLGSVLAGAAEAQDFPAEAGPIRVRVVAAGLEHPWGLAFLPDGRMLVTERPGRLRLVAPDGRLGPEIAGVPEARAAGQGGLLDVALGPGFATDRRVYVSFAEAGEGGAGTAVARGTLDERIPGSPRLADVAVIFRQAPKLGGGLHFGSRLVFARDGRLFVALGDRYRRDEAQNLGAHLGKLVRIEADGRVPADNPFIGRSDVRPEIWSLGHRNMQGAALHPTTGVLWTTEHGAQGGDEVNIPRAGRNYGWPIITHGIDYNGSPIGVGRSAPGLEQPVHQWTPSIAPSGMAFYTGDRFPAWRGNLLVGSLKFGLLHRLELDGERVVREERLLSGLRKRIRDVRIGPDGDIYLLTDMDGGEILRLSPVPG